MERISGESKGWIVQGAIEPLDGLRQWMNGGLSVGVYRMDGWGLMGVVDKVDVIGE